MDIETGELICPKCKHKKMNKATNWISRKSVINQISICNGFSIIHILVKNTNAFS